MTFIPLDTIEVKPINEALRSVHSRLYMYIDWHSPNILLCMCRQLGGGTKLVMDVIRYDPPQIKVRTLYH